MQFSEQFDSCFTGLRYITLLFTGLGGPTLRFPAQMRHLHFMGYVALD